MSQVETSVGSESSLVTMAPIQPPSPCYNSEPFLELPVKRQADTLRITLSNSRNSHYHSLSEIEIYVEESHIYSRYQLVFTKTQIKDFQVDSLCKINNLINEKM